jgi:hypothetical protein
MTRRDFELIARVLKTSRHWLDRGAHKTIVVLFANELKTTNSNFDREKFVKACGGDDDY